MQNLYEQPNAIAAVPGYKLFSAGQIAAGTFFGSIFVGGYMLAENYENLDDKKRAKSRLFRSLAYYLLYIFSAVLLSELPNSPWLAVVIGFIFIYKSEFKSKQSDQYSEHLACGGGQCSNWLVALICVLNLVAYFSIAMIAIFFLDAAGF